MNPFNPTMARVKGTLVLPCAKLADVDENGDTTDTEKSGAGGGGLHCTATPPQLNASPRRTVSKTILTVNVRLFPPEY